MSDRYSQIVNNPIGKFVTKQAGLPQVVPLQRWGDGQHRDVIGTVLFGAAPGGRLARPAAKVLASIGADVTTQLGGDARTFAADAAIDAGVFNPESAGEETTFKALLFDASGIADTEQLHELWAFFSPAIRRVEPNGRVIVLAGPDDSTAQRAIEGFTRSVGKEVRRASSCNLVRVEPGAEEGLEATLRFLLSPRSAYVSGQVVRIGAKGADVPDGLDWAKPLDGRIALVTGASRGIGAAIASVLARDGAHVLGVDIPALEDDLQAVTKELKGSALALDITEKDAPKTIAAHIRKEFKGVDVVVHNAGITRDKTLGRMDAERWDQVMAVNLIAPERITEALLSGKGLLNANGRVIGVSSISGIAGNAGQTNYATSKAGVIGWVQSSADALAEHGATINAVAPGFIETQMTARMPFATREAGRRMNSMSQGGLPIDVAETVAWLASPGSGGVNGNVVRVCGQSLIGA